MKAGGLAVAAFADLAARAHGVGRFPDLPFGYSDSHPLRGLSLANEYIFGATP